MTKIRKDLPVGQLLAIRRSLEVGVQLQRDFPEVAEDYRGGMSISKIVDKYNLSLKYGISKKIATQSVHRALRGYKGGFLRLDSYEGLIEESELEKLAREHWSRRGSEAGTILYEKGLGIFSRTREQMIEDCKKGGLIGGRNAGLASIISQGMIPWTPEEKEFAYVLSQNPDYQIKEGLNKGGRKVRLITEKINETYYDGKPVRSVRSIVACLARLRKERVKPKDPEKQLSDSSKKI